MFGLRRLYDWIEVPEKFKMVAQIGFIVLWLALTLRTLGENRATSPIIVGLVAILGLGSSLVFIGFVTKTIRHIVDEVPWSSSTNAAVQGLLLSFVILLFTVMIAFFQSVTPIMTGKCELLVFRPWHLVIMIVLPVFAYACDRNRKRMDT